MALAMDSPVELLAELARLDARVRAAADGKVTVDAQRGSGELGRACRRWKWVLVWGLHGAERGYRWFACDTCGELTALANKAGMSCGMTLNCPGQSQPIPSPRFLCGAPAPRRSRAQ